MNLTHKPVNVNNMSNSYSRLSYIKTLEIRLAPQGSDLWLENRLNQFGGSELASVFGSCPYKKRKDLISEKVNKKRFKAAACSFGRVMEDVAKKYLREYLDYKIYDFGAIKSSSYPVAYSPDGIIHREDELILLEIKCPWRRYKLEEIPKHYLPQIMGGMSILPVDYCEFIQFRFRLCSVWDIGPSHKYNRWLHYEGQKRVPNTDPIIYGYIQFSESATMLNSNNNKVTFIDLGRCSPDNEELIADLPKVEKRNIFINEIPRRPFRGQILGFKLFDMTTKKVKRDPMYLENKSKELWEGYKELLDFKKKENFSHYLVP